METEYNIKLNEDNIIEKDYFSIDYNEQNICNNPLFKKWKSFQEKKINIENTFRLSSITNSYIDTKIPILLIISYCKFCKKYTIFKFNYNSIFIECEKCQKKICIGCSTEKYSSRDDKICFKGYIKSLYLKMKLYSNPNKNLEKSEYCFIFIITFLILPIYLALISCNSAIELHPNKPVDHNDEDEEEDVFAMKIIFSLCYSILFFPYILLFFPYLFITTFFCLIVPSTRKKLLVLYEPLIGL